MITEKQFEIVLTTLEPLRIGGLDDPLSGAQNAVAKVGDRVVVPGSSLKGKLRSEIEKHLIREFYRDGKWESGKEMLQPCIPGAELSKDEEALVGKYRDTSGSCRYPCDRKKCKDRTHSICPVCYFLGAMGLSGFVRVPFLFSDVSVNELYSASMDRAKGTVKERTNRPYQLVPDGSEFRGVLSVTISDSLLNWQLGRARSLKETPTLGDQWLQDGSPYAGKSADELINEFIIERLRAIQIIGGYKSKGFGKVKVEAKEAATK